MFTGPCDSCTSQRCGGAEIMGTDLQEEGFDLPDHGVLDKAAKLKCLSSTGPSSLCMEMSEALAPAGYLAASEWKHSSPKCHNDPVPN